MPIDWTTALGAQDQSLEAQLARRDMSKQLNMLLALAKEQEDRRQFGQRQDLDERQLSEQVKYREEQAAERKVRQDQLEAERKADNKRALYGSLSSGRKPGDRFAKPALDVIAEFEGGTADYSPDPNDPLQFIYKAEEAKRLLAKAESDERLRVAAEARANEDQKLQREANERAKKDFENRQKAAERAAKTFEAKQKSLDTMAEAWPVHLRTKASALAREAVKGVEGGFFSSDDELAQKRQQAIEDVYRKVDEEARRLRQAPPPLGGRAGSSGRGQAPQNTVQSQNDYLSPEEVKAKFPSLPEGARVRRIQ